MQKDVRRRFNEQFTVDKYEQFLADLDSRHPGAIAFRVAETPVFVPRDFKDKLLAACEAIVDVIVQPNFGELTKNAIPPGEEVPGENGFAHCIAFDFGVCENEAGELEPQLIEMQGFPTLFALLN